MTVVRFNDDGPVVPLGHDEAVRCNGCGATFDASAYERFAEGADEPVPTVYEEGTEGAAQCPHCGEFVGFVLRRLDPRTTMVERWGNAGREFVALPLALIEHMGELELSGDDVAMLLQLVSFDKTGSGSCWPSQKVLAERLGCHRQAVNRRIARLVESGLVSADRRRGRPDDPKRDQTSVYRWDGLRERLERIVAEGCPSERTTLVRQSGQPLVRLGGQEVERGGRRGSGKETSFGGGDLRSPITPGAFGSSSANGAAA